ncbi:MAG: Do family serine endopeptidase [Proteobacteria bacterium]|nr:Do family serine endopeptidase [Pseudomonadota bacterium]
MKMRIKTPVQALGMVLVFSSMMLSTSLLAESAASTTPAPAATSQPQVQFPNFTPIVDNAGRSVVNIITTNKDTKKLVPDNLRDDLEGTPLMDVLKQMFGDKLDENLSGKGPGLGSGTIISADGFIVTNYHVVDGADQIIVRLQDRREFPAKVIGKDQGTDLALLKIDAKDLTPVAYADSDAIKVGEWVVAIGSPYGFENTITVGVVSATGRSLGSERYVPFIQTDAAINPGNSGGPLLNMKGQMIGINSQIITESGSYAGLSFAVPSNVIKLVVTQLQKNGQVARGWLGLAFQDLNRDLADSFGLATAKGALISKVVPNSPAAKAGIKEGDIITQFNGKEIIRATDLPPIVGLIPIDSMVGMKLIRDKQELQVSLKLSKFNDTDSEALDPKKITLAHVDKIQQQVSVREMEEFEKADLGDGKMGVMVMDVRGDPWVLSGLRRGDLVTSINGQKISNVKEFYAAVHSANEEHPLSLLISRPGNEQRFIAVKLDK